MPTLLDRLVLVSLIPVCRLLCCLLFLSAATPHLASHLVDPQLTLQRASGPGWIQLDIAHPSNGVYTLEASTNLIHWSAIASTHDALVAYPDPAATNFMQRFYRASLSPKGEANDWKNQIFFPSDSFLSARTGQGQDEIRWLKFAIVLSDPARVYYQDSQRYLFHRDFATERLEPFRGMNSREFDAVSLHLENQQVVLGTVLYPPAPDDVEYGIQFVGLDPYPAERIRSLFELVRATIVAAPGVEALYVPTFEQSYAAETNRAYFASHGIEVGAASRWIRSDQIYADGWALGRLTFVPAAQIEAAYTAGLLLPSDILLTDSVPAELPFLAGILTLTPSTPNSHVAILARTLGVPFAYVADAAQKLRLEQLTGRRIVLRVKARAYEEPIRVLDVEDELTPLLETEILELKRPPAVNLPAKAAFGAISAPADNLLPSDTRYFGGKAANFGLLRRRLPNHSPVAIAFSFDLWDQFLDQQLPGEGTLRAEIAGRLAPYTYPPVMASLQADLDAIRDLIRQVADFSPAQQQAIANALQVFAPNQKIRFRSSTNFEDTEQFTGAGLYDSYSGCLADDLDNDTLGPSLCDPARPQERGVFRAMRKVYASFYNDNAFLERLRLGVDEDQVGMGLLVHHSFPDEIELANGVATLDAQPARREIRGNLVTQAGAVPVTNPDGSTLPEVVRVSQFRDGTYINFGLQQRSSLVPLGAYVMDYDADYRDLMGLLTSVTSGYAELFPEKTRFTLDFEYKKVYPDALMVKQVRELPMPSTEREIVPFLLHEANCYGVFQGEYGNVFANHRLKSFWSFTVANLRLTENTLSQSFYLDATVEYVDGAERRMLSGPPAAFTNASHSAEGEYVTDGWTVGSGPDRREFRLRARVPRTVSAADCPVLSLQDIELTLDVSYATPVPSLDYGDWIPPLGHNLSDGGAKLITVTNESVRLAPCPVVDGESVLQDRTMGAKGVSISTSFYWAPEPPWSVGGYTAPLLQWVGTTITGLTSQPIELHDAYSQSYRPSHHNIEETFIFEPRLEPGLSQALLDELEAANIGSLQVLYGFPNPEAPIFILGLDGTLRPL